MLRSLCAFAHLAFQSQSWTSSALSSSPLLRHHRAEPGRNRVFSFRYVLRNLQMLFKALLQCLTCFKCSANVCQTNAFVSEFHVIFTWFPSDYYVIDSTSCCWDVLLIWSNEQDFLVWKGWRKAQSHGCRSPWRPEEAFRSPGDGVPGSSELPNVGAGTQTWVLWKTVSALTHRPIPTALRSVSS